MVIIVLRRCRRCSRRTAQKFPKKNPNSTFEQLV